MSKLTPIVEYENEQFILLTPQIASIPSTSLQNPIGSIESIRDEIIAAIDFAITGI
jgi:toxin CcdB